MMKIHLSPGIRKLYNCCAKPLLRKAMSYFGRSSISLNLIKNVILSKQKSRAAPKKNNRRFMFLLLKPIDLHNFTTFSTNSPKITIIFTPGRGPGARLERSGRALGARRGRNGPKRWNKKHAKVKKLTAREKRGKDPKRGGRGEAGGRGRLPPALLQSPG